MGYRLAVPDARLVCVVENEVTAACVLAARMADGSMDEAPIWDDLRTFDPEPWRGRVGCVIGGPPCQPFSNAGARRGPDDSRNLWPAALRLVAGVQPERCFFENVASAESLWYVHEEVIPALQVLGYRVEAGIYAASEVGAPHRRERLFILAVADAGREPRDVLGRGLWGQSAGGSEPMADASIERHERERDARRRRGGPAHDGDMDESEGSGWRQGSGRAAIGSQPPLARPEQPSGSAVGYASSSGQRSDVNGVRAWESDAPRPSEWPPSPTDVDGWAKVFAVRPDLAPAVESGVRDLADGMAGTLALPRADKLRILGNGVVPAQAAYAYGCLMMNVTKEDVL